MTTEPTAAEVAHRDILAQIKSLRHTFENGGALSILVWTLRNEYSKWPHDDTANHLVQMLVEGFLAEVEQANAIAAKLAYMAVKADRPELDEATAEHLAASLLADVAKEEKPRK